MVKAAPVLDERIVTNPTVTPGPGDPATGANYANSPQVLSTGITGVGQMIAVELPFLSLCSGTLINPRTVITAAHCVNDNPMQFYGSNTGAGGGIAPSDPSGLAATRGIPLSFGFAPTNRCRGTNGCASGTGPYEAWRDSGFQSQPGKFIYNANQVWYDPDSGEFGLADVALVTLDRHVENVPTWSLLFSPLPAGDTHVTITGYGSSGVGLSGVGDLAGIDFRRRSAENVVQGLMSLYDFAQTPVLFDPNNPDTFIQYQHSMYWFDFDDPNRDPNNLPANFFNPSDNDPNTRDDGYYDFDGFTGNALPHEGATAGGDSGGPLIVDQRYNIPVVAGVLTGGISFDGGIGTYGEFDVYSPLFLYWQDIVANNPYKYVSAKAGNGDWFDPTHWVQDMDPAYMSLVNGSLANTLPNVPQVGHDDPAGRFGEICFFGFACGGPTAPAYPTGTGGYIVVPGGPGTTNFVPNNVEPVNNLNPAAYKQARYYDVTLRQAGTTTLSGNATIDKLTLDGETLGTRLNIASGGNLMVWSEFNQYGGWTNVDGKLTTGEAFVASGILSGSGQFDPTYLTVIAGAVAPGGSKIATFNVKGDVVLSSASGLLIDVSHSAADQLKVSGDADNAGMLALDGGFLVVTPAASGPVARAGDKFQIAGATLVDGAFGNTTASSGVLTPVVSYTPTKVFMTLQAGSLAKLAAGSNVTTLAFANALDGLRANHYNDLWNFYGSVDWMNSSQLSATFNTITPSIVGETQLLQNRQSSQLFANVSDRLSLLGTGQAKGISVSGGAQGFALSRQDLSPRQRLGLTSGGSVSLPMTGGLSGFVTVGGDTAKASYGDARLTGAGQHSRYFASGIEAPFGDVTVGSAIGYAEATTSAGQDSATSKLTQAAAYATMPIGKAAYVGGIVAVEKGHSDSDRLTTDTVSMFRLSGATRSSRYMATTEAGFRTDIGHGLSLNPRAQLSYSHYSMGGFHEQGAETALALNSLKINRLESRIGVRLDGTTHLAGWTVQPQVLADYVRLLSGSHNGMNVSFAAAPDYNFALPLTNGGSGWMEVKGGVSLSRGAFSLGLSGQATAGHTAIPDQRGLVSFDYRF